MRWRLTVWNHSFNILGRWKAMQVPFFSFKKYATLKVRVGEKVLEGWEVRMYEIMVKKYERVNGLKKCRSDKNTWWIFKFWKIITIRDELLLIPFRMFPLTLNTPCHHLCHFLKHFWKSSFISVFMKYDTVKWITVSSAIQQRQAHENSTVCFHSLYLPDLALYNFCVSHKWKWPWKVNIFHWSRIMTV